MYFSILAYRNVKLRFKADLVRPSEFLQWQPPEERIQRRVVDEYVLTSEDDKEEEEIEDIIYRNKKIARENYIENQQYENIIKFYRKRKRSYIAYNLNEKIR